MVADRHLNWDGCYNVRDLGGLPAANGRHTRWGAIVRADTPDQLTPSGWAALQAHGIRTIVDLRNHEERPAPTSPGDPGLSTVHLPLDDVADTQFWQYCRDNGLDATPLYFLPFLQHKPERCAAAIAAIANAQPGGVLVHCRIGRDRTGLVALLLLALVGVAPDHIADDYELSTDRLPPLPAKSGTHTQVWSPREALARKKTSARAVILATLAAVDVEASLRAAGLKDQASATLRTRLLGSPDATGLAT